MVYLFALSLLIYAFIVKDRMIILCALLVMGLFSIAIFTSHNFVNNIVQENMNMVGLDP